MEKFIKGDVHRITLVGHKVAAGCMREAPNVVGDGVRAIAELIKIKTSIRGAERLIRKILPCIKSAQTKTQSLFWLNKGLLLKPFCRRELRRICTVKLF